MKLRTLINELNVLKKIHGDNIEVVIAQDPEGNGFSTLEPQSLSVVYDKEDDFIKAQTYGTLTGPNYKEIVDEFTKGSKVIGLCLFPWEEGFDSAEEACNWPKTKEEKELNRKIAMAENRLDAAKETGELL